MSMHRLMTAAMLALLLQAIAHDVDAASRPARPMAPMQELARGGTGSVKGKPAPMPSWLVALLEM
jgi:hypothetical protein